MKAQQRRVFTASCAHGAARVRGRVAALTAAPAPARRAAARAAPSPHRVRQRRVFSPIMLLERGGRQCARRGALFRFWREQNRAFASLAAQRT